MLMLCVVLACRNVFIFILASFFLPLSAFADDLIVEYKVSPPRMGEAYDISALQFTYLDNKAFNATEIRNKKVVLYFWSIYCSSCMEHLREFDAWRDKFISHDVAFVSVHLFESDGKKVAAKVASLGVNLTVLLCPTWVRDLLGIRELPTALLFDSSGIFVGRLDGISSSEQLGAELFKGQVEDDSP